MMNKYIIFGIHIKNRSTAAVEVQKVFTEYGCSIKTRLGLHEVDENACSPSGLVILEMFGDQSEIDAAEQKLLNIEGVDMKKMEFPL
jgi:hypothetical protein